MHLRLGVAIQVFFLDQVKFENKCIRENKIEGRNLTLYSTLSHNLTYKRCVKPKGTWQLLYYVGHSLTEFFST